MKGLALLCLLVWSFCAHAQNTFLKVYPNPAGFDAFNDLVRVSANEYAFITETFFYRVDAQGNVLLKKDLKEGQSTFLESLLTDNAGNFYISAQVFTSSTDINMKLFKVNSSG